MSTPGLMTSADDMTDEQRDAMVEQYAKVMNKNRAPKEAYKFPDTLEEQAAKCAEAESLRQRGNALYREGELFEAAKLYEQAVHKFADWYVEKFATDEERKMVHAVKLPSHSNLAACSWKLGNHQHCVVHCTQVLNVEPDNAKALYRRGVCYTALSEFDDAKADLRRAAEVSPSDQAVRRALAELSARRDEFAGRQKEMARKMFSSTNPSDEGGNGSSIDQGPRGAAAAEGGGGDDDEPRSAAADHGAGSGNDPATEAAESGAVEGPSQTSDGAGTASEEQAGGLLRSKDSVARRGEHGAAGATAAPTARRAIGLGPMAILMSAAACLVVALLLRAVGGSQEEAA